MLQRSALARYLDLRFDPAPLLVRQVSQFHEGIDKEAQTLLRWQAARRDVRRIDQAQLLQIAHHIADGSRRERRRQKTRERTRADRLAVPKVGIYDTTEDVARTLVERLQRRRLDGRVSDRPGHSY